MDFEAATLIAADRRAVWQILADVRNWPQWTASMSIVEPTEPGPIGLGSKVRVKQPKLPPATWTITEFDPGSSFTWVARAPGVTTTAWHRLAADGDRTRVTVGISQHGPLGRLIGLLGGSLIRRYLTMEVDGLRRRSESG
jgi:ligand-binding SRPBCC domain-containing protein